MQPGPKILQPKHPSPAAGLCALHAKLRGEELSDDQIHTLIRDIVQGRHSEEAVADFLFAADRNLSDREIAALARARFQFAEKIEWDEAIVADKHSLGGIPGSRITMIVIPIVAAHGIAIPKTSSRAITSAAGTADAMETIARIDLSVDDVKRVVGEARGCMAWNGRLNHSRLDDVMNAITRPRGLDSTRWSVASILSKKLAAGSTHVIIDIPYGPRAKSKTRHDAEELASLFARVGRSLGLAVQAHPSDGHGPVGYGIGPALEVRDVLWVLEKDPRAPADLREKALLFAARILAWDSSIGSEAAGRARALELLGSGRARVALEAIVEVQGRRRARVLPGASTATIRIPRSGVVTAVDGWTLAGIARATGAPGDLSAGIDLKVRAGENVRAGEALYVIHASSDTNLASGVAAATQASGYLVSD
jgi:thymidine phosphorylase